jgi:ribonuclease G
MQKSKRRTKEKHKIENLLKPGQEVLVQVTKDPIGTKGPRVSCNISLPGRHVVFMPNYDHIGISRKIAEEEERERLRSLLTQMKPTDGGFVARTVSQGVADDKILRDGEYLVSLWRSIERRSKQVMAPSLVQAELDILLKCARDMTHESLSRIIVDNEQAYQRTKDFLEIFHQPMSEKVELYERREPIFEYFGVEAEIARAMSRKVWLRSGGYLIIDQAEALTFIDINTGRFVGKRNLEDTILRANLEAVREVAYQLRLRNIGGVVIIDFIDMETQTDRDKVLNALIEALKKDRARCNVVKISELGLVEMTRQRTRESLERRLCEPCFYCDGKGTLKSKQTVVYEIFRQLLNRGKGLFEPSIMVHAHPEVVDLVYGEEHENLANIEEQLKKHITVRPRGSFHQEQFDIFGCSTKVS